MNMATVTASITHDKLQEYASQIELLRVFKGRHNKIYSVCFSPDGRLLATGTVNKMAYLWEVEREQLVYPLEGHGMFVWSVSFSPDGRSLATGSGDATIFFWEVATGRPFRRLEADDSLYGSCFSPDGRYFAAGSHDGLVYLWDLKTYKTPKLLYGHAGDVYSVSFSPDSRLLASGSHDHTVMIWDVAGARRLATWRGNFSRVCSICFSPDGRLLALGLSDHTIRLWSVNDGRQVEVFSGHDDLVWSVDFSADGRLLASGSSDRTVRLWSVENGSFLKTLEGHSGEVNTVNFSPDGSLLASGSDDKTVCLWDMSVMKIRPDELYKRVFAPEKQVGMDGDPLLEAQRRTIPYIHLHPPQLRRSVDWLRSCSGLGIMPPLVLLHDLGTLMLKSGEDPEIKKPDWIPADLLPAGWESFLRRIWQSPQLQEIRRWQPDDSLVGVLLGRFFLGLSFPGNYRLPDGDALKSFFYQLELALGPESMSEIWESIPADEHPRISDWLTLEFIADIEANIRKLEISELRFLCQYGPGFTDTVDPRRLLDLFNLLELPAAARLSLTSMLQLLPRIRHWSSRMGGEQTYSMGGYQGLNYKGNLDSLVPVELAYPVSIFFHRLLNNEALYYGREAQPDRRRQLIYIATQAGLEMKGDYEQVARGLTLALGRVMRRKGYEVRHSFIGSRWLKPEDLEQTDGFQRALYYRDTGGLQAGKMLVAIARQLRHWQENFQGITVFWVLNEFWDWDDFADHQSLYQELKGQAQHQAWMIARPPLKGDSPFGKRDHTGFFQHCQTIDSRMLATVLAAEG